MIEKLYLNPERTEKLSTHICSTDLQQILTVFQNGKHFATKPIRWTRKVSLLKMPLQSIMFFTRVINISVKPDPRNQLVFLQ